MLGTPRANLHNLHVHGTITCILLPLHATRGSWPYYQEQEATRGSWHPYWEQGRVGAPGLATIGTRTLLKCGQKLLQSSESNCPALLLFPFQDGTSVTDGSTLARSFFHLFPHETLR